jgi:hypothetical protein
VSVCGATLRHAHGVAVCDLAPGHDPDEERHSALCEHCQDNDPEHGDPSDRLTWDQDGESWVGGGSQGPSAAAGSPARG